MASPGLEHERRAGFRSPGKAILHQPIRGPSGFDNERVLAGVDELARPAHRRSRGCGGHSRFDFRSGTDRASSGLRQPGALRRQRTPRWTAPSAPSSSVIRSTRPGHARQLAEGAGRRGSPPGDLLRTGGVPDALVAEPGLSALLQVDRHGRERTLLFDTGVSAGGVVENMRRLGLSLGDIEAIVLSHGHWGVTSLEWKARRRRSAGGTSSS